MSDDFWAGDPFADDPSGGGDRPYPTRPYPTRPYPTRPYPTRGEEPRPYPTRPYPTRPYPTRASEPRPYPTRPYPTRPYPTRPYPTRSGGDDGDRPYPTRSAGEGPDASQWAADISELFAARSAVLRLGARVVASERPVTLALVPPGAGARYGTAAVAAARRVARDEGPPALTCDEAPVSEPVGRVLDPLQHEVAVGVVLPDVVLDELERHALTGWAVKDDLARQLALAADVAFIDGDGAASPLGVCRYKNVATTNPITVKTAQNVVATIRAAEGASFGAAGWILHPEVLGALEDDDLGHHHRRSVRSDGSDGGRLLGYPYVVSFAAVKDGTPSAVFSADWGEAWLGVTGAVATVEVLPSARPQAPEKLVRVVVRHDFAVRREELFACVRPVAGR